MSRKLKNKWLANETLLFAALVFIFAFCLRAVYLYQSETSPTFYTPIVDSETYDRIASDFVRTGHMPPRFFYQQFFYPFFLSIVYFFTNSSILCAKFVQIFLGSITCALTCRLAQKIFSPAAALLAGCIMAAYGPLIFFEAELLAVGWAAFWTAVLITLFLKAAQKKSLPLCFTLGLCAALSIITRPDFAPFIAASSLWLIFVWLRKKPIARRLIPPLLTIAAGFIIVIIPVSFQNYRLTNRFSPLPATGGLNLYTGNNPDFDPVSLRPGMKWQQITRLPFRYGFFTENQQQQFFYDKTLHYVLTQPADFIKGLLRKTARLTGSREPPGNIDIYLFTPYSRLLNLLTWKFSGFGFPFGLLLPLALLGLLLHWRTIPAPVILFCIFYPILIVLTHIEARYRIPLVVPFSILAAAALTKIARMIRSRLWRRVSLAALFCLIAAFLCSAPGPFYAERNIDYNAELYYVLAGSLEKRGRIEDALQSYSKAIELKSDYTEAHYNKALLLLKQNQTTPALTHLNIALGLDPQNSDLHRDLGLALFMTGKAGDALKHYYRALELNPGDALAHTYIAQYFKAMADLDTALKHYQKALQIEPHNPDFHYNIALLLQMLGRLDQAAQHYTQTLNINPDSVNARSNLAVVLAKQGKFDKAIKHLLIALEIEPDSPNLHFNLALAYEKIGLLNEAIAAAQKALNLAETRQDENLAASLRQRLRQYRLKQSDPNTTD